MLFRFANLHLFLAHSKYQGHTHIVNGDEYISEHLKSNGAINSVFVDLDGNRHAGASNTFHSSLSQCAMAYIFLQRRNSMLSRYCENVTLLQLLQNG